MLALHTILHPTDFSAHSQYAGWLAGALARDYGAKLIVLHVAAVPAVVFGEGLVPPNPEVFREEAEKQLEQFKIPGYDIQMERRLEDGDPVDEILQTAREVNADLIVMGTHGRTGLGRLLMGSISEQVVRKAACPVLTVKTPFPRTEAVADAEVAQAAIA